MLNLGYGLQVQPDCVLFDARRGLQLLCLCQQPVILGLQHAVLSFERDIGGDGGRRLPCQPQLQHCNDQSASDADKSNDGKGTGGSRRLLRVQR